MEKTLFGIKNFDVYAVLGILILFGILEVISGYLSRSKRNQSDWIQEFGGFFVLSVLIKPGIVLTVMGKDGQRVVIIEVAKEEGDSNMYEFIQIKNNNIFV